MHVYRWKILWKTKSTLKPDVCLHLHLAAGLLLLRVPSASLFLHTIPTHPQETPHSPPFMNFTISGLFNNNLCSSSFALLNHTPSTFSLSHTPNSFSSVLVTVHTHTHKSRLVLSVWNTPLVYCLLKCLFFVKCVLAHFHQRILQISFLFLLSLSAE